MNTKLYLMSAIFGLLSMIGMSVSAQPDWKKLDAFQETITADTFSQLLADVYCPSGAMISYLRFGDGRAHIYSTASQTGAPLFTLRFADKDQAPDKTDVGGTQPLSGLRVAIDPGHIGGSWARMEERFFLVDRKTDWPVQEGAINLFVSRLIRDGLEKRGAEVHMVRDDFEPKSKVLPDELLARESDLPAPDPRFSHLPDVLVESSQRDAMRRRAEKEFYRTREIALRADIINNEVRPDLTLCVHFNATGYGDEKTLYEKNGLAFFVQGCFMEGEVRQDEQKYFLLQKLLEQSRDTEMGVTESIRDAFVEATGLPPAYKGFSGAHMKSMGSDYIYARNLSANRRFSGPVVFLEPYFMNNRIVYARIQAGDFDGEREFEGRLYPSIFREYANAVIKGVSDYYANAVRGE